MNLPIDFIEAIICDELRLRPEELHTVTRTKDIVHARYLVMYFASHRGNTRKECVSYYGLNECMMVYIQHWVLNRMKFEPAFAREIERLSKIIDGDDSFSRIAFLQKRIESLREELLSTLSQLEAV